MRGADERAQLSAEQAAVADAGMKAMIAIDRPFLDYVLSALADAGFTEVCVVVGPEHGGVRDYYDRTTPRRLRVRFPIPERPLSTAGRLLRAPRLIRSS